MKNREKYAEEILDLTCKGLKDIAVKRGVIRDMPCVCSDISCHECIFLQSDNPECEDVFVEWCESEYKEHEPEIDWSKVPVDTPIYVSNDEFIWSPRHFALYKGGDVYAWMYGKTSFSNNAGESNMWPYAKIAYDKVDYEEYKEWLKNKEE